VYCAVSLAVIVLSLCAYAGLCPARFGDFILVDDGLLKALRHHIALGGICLIISVTAGSLALCPPIGRTARRWFAAAALVCVCALVMTGSRGYYLAAAVVLPVFAIWKAVRSARPARAALILAGILAACLTGGAFLPVVRSRVISAFSGADTNVSERLALYSVAAAQMRERPWTGWGPGSAIRPEFFSNLRATSFAHADGRLRHRHFHNFYLTIGAETGLVGLGLFFAMVYYMFSGLIRAARTGGTAARALASGTAFALAGVLIGEMFDAQLRGPGLAMDIFWICGLAAASAGMKESP
jgi:O-antigen ligase